MFYDKRFKTLTISVSFVLSLLMLSCVLGAYVNAASYKTIMYNNYSYGVSKNILFMNSPSSTYSARDYYCHWSSDYWTVSVMQDSKDLVYCLAPGTTANNYTYNNMITVGSSSSNASSRIPIPHNKYITNMTNEEFNAILNAVVNCAYVNNNVTSSSSVDWPKAVATQILLWEVVTGERNQQFTKMAVDTGKISTSGNIQNWPDFTTSGTKGAVKLMLDYMPSSSASKVKTYYDQYSAAIIKYLKLPSFMSKTSDSKANWGKDDFTEDDGKYVLHLSDSNSVCSNYTWSVIDASSGESVDGASVVVDSNGSGIKVSLTNEPETGKLYVIKCVRNDKGSLVIYSNSSNKYQVLGGFSTSAKSPLVGYSEYAFTGVKLNLTKNSSNGYSTSKTVFTLFKDNDSSDGSYNEGTDEVIGYYMHKNSSWNWYKNADGTESLGSYITLEDNTNYGLIENYNCDTYITSDGTDTGIKYDVVNVSEGWVQSGDNEYYMLFNSGNENGKTIEVQNDRVMGSISINKSSNECEVKGVVFDLYYVKDDESNMYLDSFACNSEGEIVISNLPYGKYILSEKDKTHYEITWGSEVDVNSSNNAVVTLNESNANQVVSCENRISTEIRVNKYSRWTHSVVSGTTYSIYKDVDEDGVLDYSESNAIAVVSDSDNDGVMVFEGIGAGKYFIKETETVAGYYLSKDLIKLTVDMPQTYEMDVYDEPYSESVRINKHDSTDSTVLLTGAVFEIYRDVNENNEVDSSDEIAKAFYDGELRSTVVSEFIDESGKRYYAPAVVIDGNPVEVKLHFGHYILKEVKAPENYGVKYSEVYTTFVINKVNTETITNPGNRTINLSNDCLVRTTLLNKDTDTDVVPVSGSVTVVDTVSYFNLIPGKEYKVDGVLMVKDSKEPLKNANGSVVSSSVTFTPNEPDGTVEIEFVFDSSVLCGEDIVAFEEIRRDGILTGFHKDINDERQTVHVPSIETTAHDANGDKELDVSSPDAQITDTVNYTNLAAGRLYRVEGTVMNRSTGEAVKDEQGNVVDATVTFVPDSSDGYLDVYFGFDVTYVDNSDVVVFEKLYDGTTGELLVEHEDLTNDSQTVTFPSGSISVYKVDTTGKYLSGAEFTLYEDTNEDGIYNTDIDQMVGTFTEMESGLYVFENLEVGMYFVAETKAPEGFVADSSIYPVEITYADMNPVLGNVLGQGSLSGKFVNCTPTPTNTIVKRLTATGERISPVKITIAFVLIACGIFVPVYIIRCNGKNKKDLG